MNKMFSTLLAGAALMSAVSASAAETKPTDKNLYQLKVGTNVLSTVKTKAATADSLVMVAMPEGVTTAKYKETLWKLTEVKVPNTTVINYKLTNLATGVDLSLDLSKTDAKKGAIITADKQGTWFVKGEDGNVTITAISGQETYGLKIADLTVGEETIANKVSLEKGTGTSIDLVSQKEDVVLKADDLNNLYGSSFVFDFEKDLDGNPIDGVAVKATDAEEGFVTLKMAGDKYLVVDTTRWDNKVSAAKYWKLTTDVMPTDELKEQPEAIKNCTLLANGRAQEFYSFKVQLNVAKGYILTITPAYLPQYYKTDNKEEGKQTVPSYGVVTDASGAVANTIALSWGKFANSKEVMTAPTSATGLGTATAVFGSVEVPAAIDADYTYYVKYKNTVTKDEKPKKNKDLNKFAYTNCDKAEAATAASTAIPAYMWYLEGNTMKNMMVTTVSKGDGGITIVDEKEAIYAFGSDTIQLAKGPKVEDAQKMGFKEVTKADEANGALSFRLVSALANDLYIVEKSGVLYVTNSTLDDAMKLKVVAQDGVTYKGSNGVKVFAYSLTDRLGKKNVVALAEAADLGVNLGLAAPGTEGTQKIHLAFMATGKENQYKIVGVGADDVLSLAATANAGSGIMEIGAICADKNVTFEFAQKEAPIYGAPDYGHVKITTREDDGKFIAPQTDGFAALKAEGQILKSSYSSDTLTMWLDTASTIFDEVMPLYYISSNAFTPDAKNNERNYLINPLNISAAIDAANKEAEEAGEEKVENVYPFTTVEGAFKAVFKAASPCGSDSLAMDGDTINIMQFNPAAVAFEVAAEFGDEYYRIKSNLCTENEDYDADVEGSLPYEETDAMYLAQLNNVLFWTAEPEAAEIFVINRASAPTANDAINAATITVLAKEGAVEVIGAAGKKVVISNILGQVVANTVIASDDATIAVPAGVVVVAVEGEAAVKAIVK